jgi:hypothetical protein
MLLIACRQPVLSPCARSLQKPGSLHSCQQSSQPAFWQKPAGLVFYEAFGRLDGLIGCGGSAGLMGLMGLTPNWDSCIENLVLSFSAVGPCIQPVFGVQLLVANHLLVHLVVAA